METLIFEKKRQPPLSSILVLSLLKQTVQNTKHNTISSSLAVRQSNASSPDRRSFVAITASCSAVVTLRYTILVNRTIVGSTL